MICLYYNKTYEKDRKSNIRRRKSVIFNFGCNGKKCIFTSPKDGESALKECKNIKVEESYFNLRYPFWHDDKLTIDKCELTDKCRAALWYSKNINITATKLGGIKALRECSDIKLKTSS